MLGFLHTSPTHVPTFDQLLAELAPQTQAHHLVKEGLLTEAREHGLTATVQSQVHHAVQQLVAQGATQIICTCSTIGETAEQTAVPAGVSVLRIDRPLAEQAVTAGQHITVLATLESTLSTTRQLLAETAAALERDVTLEMVYCANAWPFFERGDLSSYHTAIAQAIRTHAAEADVIVLAQASMAPAADRYPDLTVPILSSPRTAVLATLNGR